LLPRSAAQSHLCRDGGALRHGGAPGSAKKAPRQGQGRVCGADRRTLADRPGTQTPFYSLARLKPAVRELLHQLNAIRPSRGLGVTRRRLLEDLDRPHLRPLPIEPYVFAEWRARRVGIDYHVDVDNHFYSVPYRFARHEVEIRLTARTVEVFFKGER